MENDILTLIKNLSIEALVISIIVCIFTTFIKIPIKKLTSKFHDEKKKALNEFITLIPFILSIAISTVYSGIKDSIWFSMELIKKSISIWIISLSMYAIYEKLKTLIKGYLSTTNKENNFVIETGQFINNLLEQLSINESEEKVIEKKLIELNDTKKTLENTNSNIDLQKLYKINIEMLKLSNRKTELKSLIEDIKAQIKKSNEI